jgi:hypothetical protein
MLILCRLWWAPSCALHFAALKMPMKEGFSLETLPSGIPEPILQGGLSKSAQSPLHHLALLLERPFGPMRRQHPEL